MLLFCFYDIDKWKNEETYLMINLLNKRGYNNFTYH